MKRLLLICSLFLMTMVSFSETYACSGGAPFSTINFPEMEVIVHATVVDVDEYGVNAILRIDQYFKGDGSEYAVVMHSTPGFAAGKMRGYTTSCLSYGGDAWIAGSEGYFALNSNGDGTFTDQGRALGMPRFFVENGMVEIHEPSENGFAQLTWTVAQFEMFLLDVGGKTEATTPEGSSDYPLMRFLNITTESGTRYRLNPDRSLTMLEPQNDPLAISPDGSHVAFLYSENMIGLQYIFTERLEIEENIVSRNLGWLHLVPGEQIQFSPDSDFAAVWDEKSLTIYMFDNYVFAGYGGQMSLQTVGEAELRGGSSDPFTEVAWSGDSTTLVFSDARGLWSWNVFEDAEPRQIAEADELGVFSLSDVSRTGRYVRYGDETRWTLIDTETGERIENAIATPDERNLIYINAENPPETLFDLSLMDESYQSQSCTAPVSESCPIVIEREGFRQLFWYEYNQIGILSCEDNSCVINSYSWDLSVNRSPASQSYLYLPDIRQLTYDEQNDQFAEIVDDYLLKLGLFPQSLAESRASGALVDLAGQLDSPIASIEWGQPIFYREPPTVVQ